MKSTEEIRQAVIKGVQKVTERNSITLDDEQTFEKFGLDSLDRMALMLEVESHLGLDFGENNPEELRTIQDYIVYIQRTWPEA
jgi:acyl carrier protein